MNRSKLTLLTLATSLAFAATAVAAESKQNPRPKRKPNAAWHRSKTCPDCREFY